MEAAAALEIGPTSLQLVMAGTDFVFRAACFRELQKSKKMIRLDWLFPSLNMFDIYVVSLIIITGKGYYAEQNRKK